MRAAFAETFATEPGEELLTTGEAAKLLNTSRQHIVDLCRRGDLPYTTTGSHRRLRRTDVEAIRTRTDRMTRDQERSLWLAQAVAGKLVLDPDRVIGLARRNIASMRAGSARGATRRWLDEWERLLDGPIDRLLEALTSRAPRSRELRQNSPFAGALTDQERLQVLRAHSSIRNPKHHL